MQGGDGTSRIETKESLSLELNTPRTAELVLARSYATAPSPHALVLLEHRQGDLEFASLSALTAASQLGGQVTGLVVGSPDEVSSVIDKAKRLKGLSTLLRSSSPQYSTLLPEAVSPLFEKLLSQNSPFTHVVSAHSSSAKSILPRVAARLDVSRI
ncbi:adenine nucleotide alpha hydrolases-like protein [Rhizopogon vinicolor AM-OR11-026]|uniref:Probable electron transfer flavoprotein subunit alpha, mitochondrial n=1 Tax=Rhizopogon vinicolor AM-OR11-026 TaxID=1314800 RepID=A0A1B7MRH0_9AGAM|nr:adenine nucleotide alpha hydrolases-like protein [Rhizopogon vinicolor AM-OR11-026]